MKRKDLAIHPIPFTYIYILTVFNRGKKMYTIISYAVTMSFFSQISYKKEAVHWQKYWFWMIFWTLAS